MKVTDFDYQLPAELIASLPLAKRSASRLMVVDPASQSIKHEYFSDLTHYLKPGDLLVFNNSKVIPARLYAQKATGGKVELLVERVLDDHQFLSHIKSNHSPKPGAILVLEQGYQFEVIGREQDLFVVAVKSSESIWEIMEEAGHIPLPHYMNREDQAMDKDRYQNVYALPPGSVAAPTAGLHFDQDLLAQLKKQGINFAYVTLHVGAGTFKPVKVDDIKQHLMHSERLEVSQNTVDLIKETQAHGHRVIAVGTTTVRSLETAARSGELQAYAGETNIFIYPGYSFKVIDAMITNFHLPKSTLIMLVSAFAGTDLIRLAYTMAVNEQYRFFSYGDAMFICHKEKQ